MMMDVPMRHGRASGTPTIFLIAIEESGDRLGAGLMRAINASTGGTVRFAGVGGHDMVAQGLATLYSIDELPAIGITTALANLRTLRKRMRETVAAVMADRPDVVVVIDSPEFNHQIARRVRAAAPSIPIVSYCCPQVWAWRPWRARKMRAFIDHILALLPFEPAALERLNGPPCTYVGHPLSDRVADLRPDVTEAARRAADPPVLLVLPGSRPSELRWLGNIFAETLARVRERVGAFDLVLPTVPPLASRVSAAVAGWPVAPRIVVELKQKQAAFRVARAALAKSGTVTLELALAGVPMVGAYRVSAFDAFIARLLIEAPSAILANLVIGENVVPEYLQENCTPENLANALVPLLADSPQRRRQIEAFSRLDAIMEIGTRSPAARAAEIVLDLADGVRPVPEARAVANM
jgi:lipid-A-disaccharide synthase